MTAEWNSWNLYVLGMGQTDRQTSRRTKSAYNNIIIIVIIRKIFSTGEVQQYGDRWRLWATWRVDVELHDVARWRHENLSTPLAHVGPQRHVTSGLCRGRLFDDDVGETRPGYDCPGRVRKQSGQADVDALTGVDYHGPRAARRADTYARMSVGLPVRRCGSGQATVDGQGGRPVEIAAWMTVEPHMTTGRTQRLLQAWYCTHTTSLRFSCVTLRNWVSTVNPDFINFPWAEVRDWGLSTLLL